jgi:hypothetical protein
MSPAPIVRGDSLIPHQQRGNSTQQLQPPAPDGHGSRPAPRRTPSGNIMVWDGMGFVKLVGNDILDEDLDVMMEDEDDII